MRPWLAFALVLAPSFAPPARADRLVTHDGRILAVKKARTLADGSYELVFESGTITCPKEFVASVEIEGDMSDYVPANEDEKKKLADGYVRYRGKWLSKPAYQTELAKEAERSKARTAELARHSKFYDGWEKETKHFVLKSNTSPEILEHYAELLEAFYDLMDQRVGIDPSPTLKKTKQKVSIYKSRPEFTELTKVPPQVAGFFSPSEGELHFYHDYESPSESEWVALHEGTHLLTFLIEPQADPCIWINEGVADYFGSATITRNKRGKLEIQTGQLLLERVLTVQLAIADDSYVRLEDLFRTPDSEFDAFDYAHAWSFVYFLNNARPEYEKAFKKFFKDLYTIAKGVAFTLQETNDKYGGVKIVPPVEVRRLLLDKLGKKDAVALEEEWKAFVTAIPIDAPKARLRRAQETLFTADEREDLQRALEDVEAALAGGITDPAAFALRGTLQLIVTGDDAKAVADYREAVLRAPLKGAYRASLAQILAGLSVRAGGITVHKGPEEGQELSGDEEALIEAELQFGLASELEPDNEAIAASHRTFLDLLAAKVQGK
ncbi:MAG TPA: DUF1570 domain-containing protein [Planctomycetota bacterium]